MQRLKSLEIQVELSNRIWEQVEQRAQRQRQRWSDRNALLLVITAVVVTLTAVIGTLHTLHLGL